MAICWERAVPLVFHLCCFNFSAVLVVCVPFPLDVWGRMWILVVSVPDHCLFIYFPSLNRCIIISSQSLNFRGHRGTTDDVAAIPFHPSLSSAAFRESPNSIPVHSLMLSSHLFFCLPRLLAPFTVPCRIVFAMPEDLEIWPSEFLFRCVFERKNNAYFSFWCFYVKIEICWKWPDAEGIINTWSALYHKIVEILFVYSCVTKA